MGEADKVLVGCMDPEDVCLWRVWLFCSYCPRSASVHGGEPSAEKKVKNLCIKVHKGNAVVG